VPLKLGSYLSNIPGDKVLIKIDVDVLRRRLSKEVLIDEFLASTSNNFIAIPRSERQIASGTVTKPAVNIAEPI
jgi:hypothetical protein